MRTPWADGPEFVTQCPIVPGATYTYRFTIEDQEGTLWWHAHSRWLRATVYGALIILPKLDTTYPFPKPNLEIPILLGKVSNTSLLTSFPYQVWVTDFNCLSDDGIEQGNGGIGTPLVSSSRHFSLGLPQMCLMHLPLMVNLAIYTLAPVKVWTTEKYK